MTLSGGDRHPVRHARAQAERIADGEHEIADLRAPRRQLREQQFIVGASATGTVRCVDAWLTDFSPPAV